MADSGRWCWIDLWRIPTAHTRIAAQTNHRAQEGVVQGYCCSLRRLISLRQRKSQMFAWERSPSGGQRPWLRSKTGFESWSRKTSLRSQLPEGKTIFNLNLNLWATFYLNCFLWQRCQHVHVGNVFSVVYWSRETQRCLSYLLRGRHHSGIVFCERREIMACKQESPYFVNS